MILDGELAIVTGAGRGIGRACAERLARDGAIVAAVSRIKPDWVDQAKEDGLNVIGLACDVGQPDQIRATFSEIVANIGVPTILCNNAGILIAKHFLEQTEDEFDEIIDVNLRSIFILSQLFARASIEAGKRGSIINMSSINAVVALPTHAAYCASKGGINALTRAIAVALAPNGIRANTVAPGTIATDMVSDHLTTHPEAEEAIALRTPLGRVGELDEIASIVSFLASQEASYITGQTIYADGGRLALNMVMQKNK